MAMGQLPHAFIDSISRTARPFSLRLSGESLHVCPQIVLEFGVHRDRTERVCFLPHGHGEITPWHGEKAPWSSHLMSSGPIAEIVRVPESHE
jgi:hypothetical protein